MGITWARLPLLAVLAVAVLAGIATGPAGAGARGTSPAPAVRSWHITPAGGLFFTAAGELTLYQHDWATQRNRVVGFYPTPGTPARVATSFTNGVTASADNRWIAYRAFKPDDRGQTGATAWILQDRKRKKAYDLDAWLARTYPKEQPWDRAWIRDVVLSPTGNGVAVHTYHENRWRLFMVALGESGPHRLTDLSHCPFGPGSRRCAYGFNVGGQIPVISGDGRWIAFVASRNHVSAFPLPSGRGCLNTSIGVIRRFSHTHVGAVEVEAVEAEPDPELQIKMRGKKEVTCTGTRDVTAIAVDRTARRYAAIANDVDTATASTVYVDFGAPGSRSVLARDRNGNIAAMVRLSPSGRVAAYGREGLFTPIGKAPIVLIDTRSRATRTISRPAARLAGSCPHTRPRRLRVLGAEIGRVRLQIRSASSRVR